MSFHVCNCLQQTTRMFLQFCKICMKTWQFISNFYCIRPSINQDNSTFLGNKFTNSCSRNEYWELYTQQEIKFYLYYVSLSFVILEVTTVDMWQLQFIFFEVKCPQDSKHINKSIIVATLSMCRSECLVVRGEKEGKGKFWSSCFKFVSTGKSDFSQENNIA
jgi:hypothetical protein